MPLKKYEKYLVKPEKEVAVEQQQDSTPKEIPASYQKYRVKNKPSLNTFTREGYQAPSDQDPFYDTAKQVPYQIVRGLATLPGNLVDLAQAGIGKGLDYFGAPQKAIDIANYIRNQVGSIQNLPTTEIFDEFAKSYGINPNANTEAGRIAGNIAEIGTQAYAGGTGARGAIAAATGEAIGEGADQAGLPSAVGTTARVGSALVGSKSPKLIGTKKQKPIIDFLRKNGFTDNQITPLIQDPRKVQIISKVAFKGGKPARISRELKESLGGIYDRIRTEGDAIGILTSPEKTSLTNELYNIRNKIPLKWQRLINPIINRFENSTGKASDLINLYQDVGAEVAGQEGGKAILGLFKQPAAKGLGLIKPELASDFRLTNQLYGLNKKFGKAFKPTLVSNLSALNIGQAVKFVNSLSNLNLKSISKDIGILAARKFSTQLLTNPRMQNITKRIISNANANKSALVISGIKNLIKEIKKTDPETARKIEQKTQSTSTSASK